MTKAQNKKGIAAKAVHSAETATVDAVLDIAIGAMHLGAVEIRSQMDKIIAGTAEKSKHDKASRLAFLAEKAGSIADSARKVEAARHKRLTGLTRQLVVAWFRTQLTAPEQEQVLRELAGANEGRNIFG